MFSMYHVLLKPQLNLFNVRLSKQAQQSFDGGSGVFEDLGTSQTRPSELAKIFQNLYSDGRLQALDALEETWGGKEHEIMKAKLVFTVTVVSMTCEIIHFQ